MLQTLIERSLRTHVSEVYDKLTTRQAGGGEGWKGGRECEPCSLKCNCVCGNGQKELCNKKQQSQSGSSGSSSLQIHFALCKCIKKSNKPHTHTYTPAYTPHGAHTKKEARQINATRCRKQNGAAARLKLWHIRLHGCLSV